MTRILIVVPRDRVREAIETMYALNMLHIHDHVEGSDGLEIGKPLEGAEEASAMLVRLRAMMATLGIEDVEVDRPTPISTVLKELREKVDSLEREVESLGENRTSLEGELRSIEAKLEALEPYIAVGVDLDLYEGYERVEPMVGTVGGDPRRALDEQGLDYELFRPEGVQGGGLMALFVRKEQAEGARALLTDLGFGALPPVDGEGDPRDLHYKLTQAMAKVRSSLEDVNHSIKRIRETYGQLLVSAEEHLSIEVEKAESPLRFGSTPNALFVEGWVPTESLEEFEGELTHAVGSAVHVERVGDDADVDGAAGEAAELAADGGEPEEAEHDEFQKDPTPVLLKNPYQVSPYTYLIGLVSTPSYKELDPSLFMYFTFPVFFGMMLGDIGYGIIMAVVAWELMKRTKTDVLRRLELMILISGLVTIFWGFIYGEAIGFELYGYPHGKWWPHNLYIASLDLYLPINRLEDAMLMMKLCIYVGIFHVLFGHALGFVNEGRTHGYGHAFLAKGSWFFVVIGGFLVFSKFFGDDFSGSDPTVMAGLVLLLAGIVMLLAGEGAFGVLELPGILSNILSYTRLFAIGLSSLGIAMTFNTLAGMLWETGIAGAIAGVVVAFLGHALNLGLGLLGPTLHSLRLHYVEWMTKFFTGGGTLYAPFGRKRVYTEV